MKPTKAPPKKTASKNKGWYAAAETALNHLATMGPDTFVFGLIILLTFGSMIAGVGLIAPITGLLFALLYIFYRERLYKIQVQERFDKIDYQAGKRAGDIIDATATDQEKLTLDSYSDKAQTLELKQKAKEDGRT